MRPPSKTNHVHPQDESSPPLLNDAYTHHNSQDKAKLIDLLAAMTCVENGITMNDVDRRAIEEGLRRAF